jgi:hypothetical protein
VNRAPPETRGTHAEAKARPTDMNDHWRRLLETCRSGMKLTEETVTHLRITGISGELLRDTNALQDDTRRLLEDAEALDDPTDEQIRAIVDRMDKLAARRHALIARIHDERHAEHQRRGDVPPSNPRNPRNEPRTEPRWRDQAVRRPSAGAPR